MKTNDHPERKRLSHEIPFWARDDSLYFITICCDPRGQNQLCHTEVAKRIFESIVFRNETDAWHMRLCVLMPDHVHVLVSFPHEASMKRVVSSWKERLAKQCGVNWQRDFFDHRLRGDEGYLEKANYIRENPVRKGLIVSADAWPYKWEENSTGSR